MPDSQLVEDLEELARASVTLTEEALRRTGARSISLQQWRAIQVVAEAAQGVRISDVARQVDVTVPATGRLLKRLEERGLLSLEREPDGSKAQVARLTAEGRALLDEALDERRRALAAIVSRLQEPQAAAVLAELTVAARDVVEKSTQWGP